MITLRQIQDAEELDLALLHMNELGEEPVLAFIDANGTASIAHGTAPGGDGWAVDYEAPRDPDTGLRHCCECYGHTPAECDTGLRHCCECYGHTPAECDCGALWTPTFPITVMERERGCLCPPPVTSAGGNCARCGRTLVQP